MEVLSLIPRGFCHGVVSAVNTLKNLSKDPTIKHPITVLGMVVHNKHIVNEFSDLGITTIDIPNKTRLSLLDDIDEGTVVITAHGVSDAVYAKANAKGLDIIDTTCRDVKKSQQAVKDKLNDGYHVLFIGKKHHPEVETALSYSDNVYLIDTLDAINSIPKTLDKVVLTNQTTMSLMDIYKLSEAVKKRFPHLEIIKEQCNATYLRQLAVMNQPNDIDFCFIVGDPRSNNSNKLVEVSIEAGIPAKLVESVEAIDLAFIKNFKKVSVSSGASTPTHLTKAVIQRLKTL